MRFGKELFLPSKLIFSYQQHLRGITNNEWQQNGNVGNILCGNVFNCLIICGNTNINLYLYLLYQVHVLDVQLLSLRT